MIGENKALDVHSSECGAFEPRTSTFSVEGTAKVKRSTTMMNEDAFC
jgi:hypothetical protein